jgi:hypothetical protein
MIKSSVTQETTSITSTNPKTEKDGAYAYHTQEIEKLDKRVKILENQSKPEEDYFKSAKRINNISLVIFLLLPILQLVATLVILIIFGKTDDSFINIAKWLVGFIGFGAIVELVYVPYRIKLIEDKLKESN